MVTSGKPNLIRRYNRDLIRDLIQTNGPVTKVELSRLSGASVPTVNKIVNQLEADGEVCRADEDANNALGRKAVSYIVNKEAGYFIVFFVQNGCITAGLANNFGEILEKKVCRPDMTSLNAVNQAVFDLTDHYLKKIPAEKLNAVGLGVPGVIDPHNNIIAIPTVPCWEGIDLITLLEERYHVPVFLENDVKLMTIGLYKSEFQDRFRNMVFLYVSEGLGAGIIINGRLYKGSNHFAGEYGFMVPDFETSFTHPDWTGDLEVKLRPSSEKKAVIAPHNEKDRVFLTKVFSGVITNFIAVLNPDAISISAPDMTEEDLAQIRKMTIARVPDSCMPELSLTDGDDYGINGVVELCMAGVTTKISLIDETGL